MGVARNSGPQVFYAAALWATRAAFTLRFAGESPIPKILSIDVAFPLAVFLDIQQGQRGGDGVFAELVLLTAAGAMPRQVSHRKQEFHLPGLTASDFDYRFLVGRFQDVHAAGVEQLVTQSLVGRRGFLTQWIENGLKTFLFAFFHSPSHFGGLTQTYHGSS
jgi:hypothetical protein